MYKVTLILPKNKEILEKKYAQVLANIVSDMLTLDELGYLIQKLKENKN